MAREHRDGWVVCDVCGLHQEYVTADNGGIAPCLGPLGLSCCSETCITVERYREEIEP